MPRPKGKTPLSSNQKIDILLEKDLQILTQEKIGERHYVSRVTVNQLREENLNPTERLTLEEKRAEMVRVSSSIVLDGLKSMHDSVLDNQNSLRDVAGATKIAHDILQIQTGSPTEIRAILTDEDKARELFRCAIEELKFSQEKAIEGVKEIYPAIDVKLLTE